MIAVAVHGAEDEVVGVVTGGVVVVVGGAVVELLDEPPEAVVWQALPIGVGDAVLGVNDWPRLGKYHVMAR